jgi:outer membrane protein TolC
MADGMKLKSFMGLVFVSALVATNLMAAQPLTLEEATQKALSANPRLQASRLTALAAKERAKEAVSRHFGEVDLVGSYNNYESERLVRPISIDLFKDPKLGFYQLPWDRNQTHYGITYEIPLLAAGGLHEGRLIAKLSYNANESLALYTETEIRYNVRAAYRNALTLGHALTSVSSYEEALAKDVSDAELRVKTGAWALVDASKVRFAYESAKSQREAVAAQLASAEALLAALMGEEPPEGGYDLADVPIEPASPAEDFLQSTTSALSGRYDLKAAKDSLAIAERKKKLALEAFSPQLMLAGNYLTNNAPSLADRMGTQEFGIYLKIPLFKGMQRVFEVQAANKELLAAKQQEYGKELEVRAQVQDAIGRLKAARAQLDAGKAQKALGAEVARVEHLKLSQGTGKMEDYLAARAQELQGETGYWQGLYALQSAVDYYDFVCARGGQHE